MSYGNELTNAEEKKLFNESCILFSQILDDLKTKKILRTIFIPIDVERLRKIWQNSCSFGTAFNKMVDVFRSPEIATNLAKKANMTPNTFGYIFYSQLVGTALYDYEAVLKTSFLFFMEQEANEKSKKGIRKDMTLRQLFRRLKEISPTYGQALYEIIDMDLRNSLAHGTFWFDKNNVYLAENSYLDDVTVLTLAEFWKKTRRINIISHAFIEILMKKVKSNYFKL